MHRRIFTALLAGFLVATAGSRTLAARFGRVSLDAPTMKAALRTETPEEEGYIDEVLRRVKTGQLPKSLVESAFWWARQKPEHRFQYFRKALRVLAGRLGYAAP